MCFIVVGVTLFLPSWKIHRYMPRLLVLQSCALSAQPVRSGVDLGPCDGNRNSSLWFRPESNIVRFTSLWTDVGQQQAGSALVLIPNEFLQSVLNPKPACSCTVLMNIFLSKAIKWTAKKQKRNEIWRSCHVRTCVTVFSRTHWVRLQGERGLK